VRKANESGSAEEKAAAEAAYREAQDAFKKIRDGEEPEEAPAAEAADDEPAADEAPADEPAMATDRTDDDAEDAADAEAPATDEEQ